MGRRTKKLVRCRLLFFIWMFFGCRCVCSFVSPTAKSTGVASKSVTADSSKAAEISTMQGLSEDPVDLSTDVCVRNFRAARGLSNIYRCAKTDGLARRLYANNHSNGEMLLLERAGLILDLRSDSERSEKDSQTWMSRAPGGKFSVQRDSFSPPLSSERVVLRLDPLSPSTFMAYLDKNWMTPQQKLKSNMYKIVDGKQLHNLRMEVLNTKGLAGLNEAILETGKHVLKEALTAIVLHLEKNPTSPVVIHCVQGKDRTGLSVMLCQSVLGISDDVIIDDYHLSESMLLDSSAVTDQLTASVKVTGKIDKRVFSGAPREVMESTLSFLRYKYGSVSPGYLDAIGFHESWQSRLKAVLGQSKAATSNL
jgi:hypothetical protein